MTKSWRDGRDVDAELINSVQRRRTARVEVEEMSGDDGEQELVPWLAPNLSSVDTSLLESLE